MSIFPTPHFAPGIYFGLSFAAYNADPSFRSSFAKDMQVSATNAWFRSRLNPNWVDDDTKAKAIGRAYHTALLEGQHEFDAGFVVGPTKAEYDGALDTVAELKKAAAELGLKIKSGTLKEDIWRLIDQHDTERRYVIWPKILEDFQDTVQGRHVIDARDAAEMRTGMFILRNMPTCAQAFSGGYPEVSIFWLDDETGAPMKVRLDYLKTKAIIDLKTFANKSSLPLKQAAIFAMLNQKNNLQPPMYLDGMAAAAQLYREHGDAVVHGEVDRDWLAELMADPPTRFVFMFLQKGLVPEPVPLEFRRSAKPGGSMNGYYAMGWQMYRSALREYARCMIKFGPSEPWIIDRPTVPLEDSDFPLRALESEPEELEEAA